MKAPLLALALCALGAQERPAPGKASVRKDRPRIFLRADGLSAWQDRFKKVPELRDLYAATKRDVLRLSAPHSNPYVSSMELQSLALLYMTEGRAKEPLEKARKWMDAYAAKRVGDHWGWPLVTRALSLAFDWFHPDLTAEERKRYGEAIVRYAEATLSYAGHDDPPANATWCNQVSDYFNQFYWHQGRVPFAAAALAGEAGFEQAAEKYLGMADTWLHHHMLPATNQAGEGGGWFESLGYNQMTTAPFADLLELWRTATGEDLFPQSKFLPGNCAWVLHSLIPHTGKYVPLDDVHPGSGPGTGNDSVGSFAPLLAVRYRDPYAQHFTRTLFPSTYAFFNFPYLLWYDPAVPAADLARIEKSRAFAGLGQANLRTGWGKEDALAVYRAGRIYGGHGGHYAAGHFLLYRKGHLLVEDGYYGVMAPEAHNTLWVGGEMRKLARSTHQHFIEKMDGSTFDFARITSHAHDPEFARYDWIDSDLSKAYAPAQAERVTRRFVLLRPRTFLVIDHVRSAEAVEKRFRLRAPAAPQIDAAKRMATWSEGQGRLHVQSLLPAEARLEAAAGKESHLLSVSTSRPQAQETLLHLLHAADLEEPPPGAELLAVPAGWIGLRVRTPEATWAVLFRAAGDAVPEVSYTVPADGPIRHLVADLAGKSGRVTGPGAPPGTLKRDPSAPLYFETGGGGSFSVRDGP